MQVLDDLHTLKGLLQSHFSDGLVVVVGSGLSCAEGLPGMPALTLHLGSKLLPQLKPQDARIWQEILPDVTSRGLETALLTHAPSPDLEASIVRESANLIHSFERSVIAEVFAGTRTLRFTRLLRYLIKPSFGLPIITTNYDRLIEVAAEECGLGVDTMFVGAVSGRLDPKASQLSFCRDVTIHGKHVRKLFQDRINLCKPHGSLDWYFRAGKPIRYSGELDAPRLIITPGLNKFRNGYESPFDHHRERANSAIDKAARFLIIGYGFNDDHLETHLTPMIRNGKQTLMLTYQLSKNASGIARECGNVIGLEHGNRAGVDGTVVTISRERLWLPKRNLWDLNTFIPEVFEPCPRANPLSLSRRLI